MAGDPGFLQEVAEAAKKGLFGIREIRPPAAAANSAIGHASCISLRQAYGRQVRTSRALPPHGRLVALAIRSKIPTCPFPLQGYPHRMSLTATLASQLRRLSPREKAAIADHLWREAEAKLAPTASQLSMLNHRVAAALRAPHKLKSVGDAVRRLRR